MKQSFKASFEKLTTPHDTSVLIRQFDKKDRTTHPYWHYHPEIELVYVNGGSGKRHIGSHMSYFHDGELILIGSNLPHEGFTNRLSNYTTETVVQMLPDFLGKSFFTIPEMKKIKTLLERSKLGLSFYGMSKETIGKKIERLPELGKYEKIISILDILGDLADSKEFNKLNSEGYSLEVASQDNDRINIVMQYIRLHFKESVALADISDLVGMTIPSFCRYFKKVTGKTFTQFLNEYRLVHASKLLAEEKMSINDVCFESGFSNYSHFNKQFSKFTGKNPSAYRAEVRLFI